MMKKIMFIFFICLLTFTFLGWGTQEKLEKRKAYIDITPKELYQMLKKKDLTLINVHIPYASEIPQTDLFIPYNEIEKHADKLPQKKNAKIVIYCRSDRMSNIASLTLAKMGYTNILNLKGGMVAWKEAGYDLIHRKENNKNYCRK